MSEWIFNENIILVSYYATNVRQSYFSYNVVPHGFTCSSLSDVVSWARWCTFFVAVKLENFPFVNGCDRNHDRVHRVHLGVHLSGPVNCCTSEPRATHVRCVYLCAKHGLVLGICIFHIVPCTFSFLHYGCTHYAYARQNYAIIKWFQCGW